MIVGYGELLPTGLAPSPLLAALPDARAGRVEGPELGPWLRRKKDARLMARAAALAMPAAGRAMAGFDGDPEELGIFVAVGREPPDEGEAEDSLAAMATDGRLDLAKLGGRGRDLYPPLLPLRTLPNMVLAHVAIQWGIRGENGVQAGGPEAGWAAWRAACLALAEGRCREVLVGAACSSVDLASARDRLRLGLTGPPGEGAIFVRLRAPEPAAVRELAAEAALCAEVGDVGPVAGLAPLRLRARATLALHGEP